MEEYAIELKNVTKSFRVYYDKGSTLKERILFRKRNRYETRSVLKGISLRVRPGEAIGLIGQNGCGKSTTLKILSRILCPDSGEVVMNGRVSSLIELGAGFHPDMSGRENIYTNASIFGLSRSEIERRIDDIIEFSELENFIDNPVRTYSSGMYMRLAFAVAINVSADILLIDEILAVGDMAFQTKCFNKLKEIKKNGTTIVIVSHSLNQIEEICERSYWIDDGVIRLEGEPRFVHPQYMEYMGTRLNVPLASDKKTSPEEDEKAAEAPEANEQTSVPAGRDTHRYGSGEVHIDSVRVLGEDGSAKDHFKSGESIRIVADYHTNTEINDAMIGFGIFRVDGVHVAGTNTYIDHMGNVSLKPKGTIVCDIKHINLVSGDYLLDFAIHSTSSHVYDDWKEIQHLIIYSDTYDIGVVHIEHEWIVD